MYSLKKKRTRRKREYECDDYDAVRESQPSFA